MTERNEDCDSQSELGSPTRKDSRELYTLYIISVRVGIPTSRLRCTAVLGTARQWRARSRGRSAPVTRAGMSCPPQLQALASVLPSLSGPAFEEVLRAAAAKVQVRGFCVRLHAQPQAEHFFPAGEGAEDGSVRRAYGRRGDPFWRPDDRNCCHGISATPGQQNSSQQAGATTDAGRVSLPPAPTRMNPG